MPARGYGRREHGEAAHASESAKQIKGGIAERESAISISNVMILTSGGVATRIGYRMEGAGTATRRVRIAKKGGEILDKKA